MKILMIVPRVTVLSEASGTWREVAGVQKKIAYWSEWKSPACGVSCFLMHLSMNNFPTLCLFFWLNITLEQLVTQLVYKCFHTRRPDITAFLWSSSGEAFELSRLFAQSTLHLCDCSESLNYIASQPHTLRVLDSSRAALWHHFCHKFYVQFLNTTMEWRVRCLITLGWCGRADGCLGLPYQTCVGGRGWMMDGWMGLDIWMQVLL